LPNGEGPFFSSFGRLRDVIFARNRRQFLAIDDLGARHAPMARRIGIFIANEQRSIAQE
jgi:hypothetical protein